MKLPLYSGKWHILIVVSCVFALFLLNTSETSAAGNTQDPTVAVSVDITSHASCREVFRANIGTSYETTTQIPCLAATISEIQIIPRSKAVAQHKQYIVFPSGKATATDWQYVRHQFSIQAQQKMAPQTSVHPLTRCGQTGSGSLTWTANSPWGPDTYSSTITFFKATNCKTVEFDTSSIHTIKSVGSGLDFSWVNDLYAGYNYGPGCPTLTQGSTYSYGVNSLAPAGYYYENWVDGWSACYYGGASYYDNIGPIN